MKKPLFLIFSFFLLLSGLSAQQLAVADENAMRKKEDSLQLLAKNLIVDSMTASRMRNDSLFVRTLIRSLQVKHSFYYPFDSLKGVSKVYAPDSTFRIFTWTLAFDDYYARQRGAIQMRTADGSLKLIPLHDVSEFTEAPHDSVRSKNNWIGAAYYNIIKTEHKGKPFYTLFGFDNHSVRSNKKWIEVLHFDDRGQAVFGGPFFSFEQDTAKKKRPVQYRYSIEYKKEASTLVNYIEDEGMILIDHLVSENDEPEKPYTFIPDGDYEGFKWQNGKWVHIEKVFDFKLEDGQFPMPDPLLDDKGTVNEEKLNNRNEKNKTRKNR
ncbi:MAG TPA: hypothetical protein VHK69_14395 [Chitinophagaceae bacterium]|nr:hypothetical protein [Chitinophagaceae bacterium]